MFDVEAFILVGGASSRMGEDKSLLVLAQETTVERIGRELSSVVVRISLVGSRQPKVDLGLKNIRDLRPGWGALGGIYTALSACQAEWAAVVACDLPFVTGELFLRLLQIAWTNQDAPPDAVVPIQADLRAQPLCALYRRESCLKEAEKLIVSGEHKPRALLASVRTEWVEFRKLADLPGAEYFFFNVNTPAEYEQAKQILATF